MKPEQTPTPQPFISTSEPSRKRRFIVIGGALLLIAIIIATGVVLLTKGDATKTTGLILLPL